MGFVSIQSARFLFSLGALSARSGFGVGLGVHMLSAIVWVWCGLSVGLVTVSRLGSFLRSGCPLGSIWVWCRFGERF